MEGGFAYGVMHTSPIALVGIPALIFAGMLLIVCLAERIPPYLYIRHTFFYLLVLAGTCMVSVGAWQYVAAALSFWPLVLTATPVEAICGYYYYKVAEQDQAEEGGKLVLYRFLYWTSMLLLTVGGAMIWSKGMQLISGSTPVSGFLVVWAVLFILALIVGEVAWLYAEKGLKPIYVLLRKPGNIQEQTVVKLAVRTKLADPRLPKSIGERDFQVRFDNLADLLRAEGQPITKEGLLTLYDQHYKESDYLRAQKEAEDEKTAQALKKKSETERLAQAKKAEMEQLAQTKLDEAAHKAVLAALEIIVGRSIIPPSEETHELYFRRLTRLADELKFKGETLTSDRLVRLYDELWGGNGRIESLIAEEVREDD